MLWRNWWQRINLLIDLLRRQMLSELQLTDEVADGIAGIFDPVFLRFVIAEDPTIPVWWTFLPVTSKEEKDIDYYTVLILGSCAHLFLVKLHFITLKLQPQFCYHICLHKAQNVLLCCQKCGTKIVYFRTEIVVSKGLVEVFLMFCSLVRLSFTIGLYMCA